MNGLNHVLVYADVNLLENINVTKNNSEIFIHTNEEFGLQVNEDKTKYMNVTCGQNQ
jgi:hypothetical protein